MRLFAWSIYIYYCNILNFPPPIVIYDQQPINSLSSPDFLMRGMVSVVAMVTVPPDLCIVSHGVEVSDVVSFSMGSKLL